jgi:hypothetical protein
MYDLSHTLMYVPLLLVLFTWGTVDLATGRIPYRIIRTFLGLLTIPATCIILRGDPFISEQTYRFFSALCLAWWFATAILFSFQVVRLVWKEFFPNR